MFGYSATVVASYAIIASVTGFALWKGGPAERRAAALYLLLLVISLFINAPKETSVQATIFLCLDAVLAFWFLAMAVRYSNLWLAAAMIIQGIIFGVHAYRLGLDENIYWQGMNLAMLLNNLLSMLLINIFIAATVVSWRARRKQRRAAPRTSVRASLAAA